VLDLEHLERYTVGNREFEQELLKLFRAQLLDQIAAIAEAVDADQWRFATHTLKGVARSLGAWSIAETAERLEQLGHGGDRRRLLEELEAEVAACKLAIDRIIGLPPSR
jgi:HPt (histidine-containing phosphotransfer) domain-containing protein